MKYTFEFFNSGEKTPGEDHATGIFKAEGKTVLEVRVSGTALVTSTSGLRDVNIKQWVENVGEDILKKEKPTEGTVVQIKDMDVRDKEIITPYKEMFM